MTPLLRRRVPCASPVATSWAIPRSIEGCRPAVARLQPHPPNWSDLAAQRQSERPGLPYSAANLAGCPTNPDRLYYRPDHVRERRQTSHSGGKMAMVDPLLLSREPQVAPLQVSSPSFTGQVIERAPRRTPLTASVRLCPSGINLGPDQLHAAGCHLAVVQDSEAVDQRRSGFATPPWQWSA